MKRKKTQNMNTKGNSNLVIVLILVAAGIAFLFLWNYQKQTAKTNDGIDEISLDAIENSNSSNDSVIGINNITNNKIINKIGFSGILLVFATLLMALVVLNTVKKYLQVRKQLKSENKDRGMNEDGQAMTEFIIIFPIILIITTCIMQASLLKCAKMIVNYSAFCAARAAIVWIPEPPKDGEISYYPSQYGNMDEEDINNMVVNDDDAANIKMFHIRSAARIALTPAGSQNHNLLDVFDLVAFDEFGNEIGIPSGLMPDLGDFETEVNSTFEGILGDIGNIFMGMTPAVARRMLYVNAFSEVLLLDSKGKEVQSIVAKDRDPVTIGVSLLYHLHIPLANAIIGGHMDTDMAEGIGLTKYLPSGCDFIQFNDETNYYTVISDRSTLLVERKFNHDKHRW